MKITNNKLISISLLIYTISLLFIFIAVFLCTRNAINDRFIYTETGQIGDTIGGISAPFIGVATAILTFLAFYIQFKANEKHSIQFSLEEIEKNKNNIMSVVYYLIGQNRKIAQSISIDFKQIGTDYFELIYKEFLIINFIVKDFYPNLDDKKIVNASYIILYNGVNVTSLEINKEMLKTYDNSELLLDIFSKIEKKNESWRNIPNDLEEKIVPLLNDLNHKPFLGHMSNLGHYFRNLYHIFKYISDVKEEYMNFNEKYEIMKSLRTQMTSYEQIVILLNSQSKYGDRESDKGYLSKYKIIKNIPLPLINSIIKIKKIFPKIQFEWE